MGWNWGGKGYDVSLMGGRSMLLLLVVLWPVAVDCHMPFILIQFRIK
jgi:hypothetical protein